MSWGSFFGKTANPRPECSTIPGVTPLQQQRVKQIESLSAFNYNVSEEERDKEYRVTFTASKKFILRITLPDRFPDEKPLVQISPKAVHPWIDKNMHVVGCDALNNFYMHSNLGKIVKQIVEEFIKNPPYNSSYDQYSNNTAATQDPTARFPSSQQSNHSTPTAMLISTDSMQNSKDIVVKKDLSECRNVEELIIALQDMPMEDIKKFSEDSDALFQYVMKMEMVTDLKTQREAIVASNERIAEHNLTFKPKIEDAKKRLQDSMATLESLQSQFQSNSCKQDEIFQVFDLPQIVTNIRIAISQSEESTEEMTDKFLDKKIPLDEFSQKFLEQRKLLHLRKAKEERIRYLNPQY